MLFWPDLEVMYSGMLRPEYQTLMSLTGGTAGMLRNVMYKHPFVKIRVIEPIEYKTIIDRLERYNIINFKELVEIAS